MTRHGEQDVLRARARRLATPPSREDAVERETLVVFTLNDEAFAVPARVTAGVARLRQLAPVPGAPPGVAGLTAWRGGVLTVLDPRALLGLPASALDDRAWLVVIGAAGQHRGLLAGALRDVTSVPTETIHTMPDAHPLVRGRTPDAVVVLRAERLYNDLA